MKKHNVSQEYQELLGIWEVLPKSQENVKKTAEFLEILGKCQELSMMC